MIFNIAVCDDDPKILSLMTRILNKFLFMRDGISLEFDTFENPDHLLHAIKNGKNYNIFFLDVEMPEIDGIELARNISGYVRKDIYIIFVSNYPKYMQESFSVHPFFYMQKPVTEDALFPLLDEIASKINDKRRSFILLDDEENEYPIDIEDIIYIETEGRQSRNCSFHLPDQTISSRGNIQNWAEKLSDFSFLECHRGILVNISHIHFIHDHVIVLDNGENIPISRRNEKKIKDEMLNQIKTYLK